MYAHSADVYDLLNTACGKDYEAETERVIAIVLAHNPGTESLLDVACGTGKHLSHLRRRFDVTGLELDPAMRQVASRVVPDVTVHAGDMRSFDLAAQFDAVTCLFSAIGYMLTRPDLDAAMVTMARHLSPGGVLVLEPWFHPDQWIEGFVLAEAANDTDLAVGRVSQSTRLGHLSRFDFHYTIARPRGVQTFIEPHEAALWTIEEYRDAMESSGLIVEHDQPGLTGRGLFIGRKPAA